jgi:hypothetical protein
MAFMGMFSSHSFQFDSFKFMDRSSWEYEIMATTEFVMYTYVIYEMLFVQINYVLGLIPEFISRLLQTTSLKSFYLLGYNACCMLVARFLCGLLFDTEDGGGILFGNVG